MNTNPLYHGRCTFNQAEGAKLVHWNKKLYAMLMTLVMLVEVFSLCIGFSSLTSSTTIPNTVKIAVEYAAKSGLPGDIQTAVNSLASAGGTVIIPAGNWTWNGGTVTIPPGVNVIGTGLAGCSNHTSNWASYTPQTILYNTFQQGSPSMPTMFQVNVPNPPQPCSHTATRISGIEFVATAPRNYTEENDQVGQALAFNQIFNFRCDHCTFVNFCNVAASANAASGDNASETCYGVFDHDVVTNPYKTTPTNDGSSWAWGYGFYAGGNNIQSNTTNWSLPVTSFFGQYGPEPSYTILYVEDCHFSYCRHCTDAMEGGFVCDRFDLFDSPACAYATAMVDCHGNSYGGWAAGGRGEEVYNCTFIADTSAQIDTYTTNPHWDADQSAIYLRGGSALMHNNNFTGDGAVNTFASLLMTDDPSRSYWNCGMDVNQTYIWNNVYTNCSTYVSADPPITLNQNYFLRAPTLAQDGFTYTPYPYPNPRTLG